MDRYSNKEVSLQFDGQRTSFFLSQALFSSFDIDQGSRLLLKSLPERIDPGQIGSILDLGCGVGTLGLALKKRYPHTEVTLQDRDALAVAFTEINAHRNGMEAAVVNGGLAFQGFSDRYFDLIVSNVPAKVGDPVLRHLYLQMLEHLKDNGIAAIVVVNRIAGLTVSFLEAIGGELLFRESSTEHTVIHFRRGPAFTPSEKGGEENTNLLLEPYIRSDADFQIDRFTYRLEIVWGEADFDTSPYTAYLISRILNPFPSADSILFWNPGQGHIPVLLHGMLSAKGEEIKRIYCACRDMLALLITRRNLLQQGLTESEVLLRYAADPSFMDTDLRACCGLMVVICENLAGLPHPEAVLSAAERVLYPGGNLLITGKSAHLNRFPYRRYSFSPRREKKHRGYKAIILKRL